MSHKNDRLVAIVDSNDVHRSKVSAALMSFYDTCDWGNSKEAIKGLEKSPPALILLTSYAEPFSSVGFIQAIRAHSILKNTPILYIAESETDPGIEKTKEAGANGYIAKPYPRSVLIQTISKKLNAGIEEQWEALPDIQRDALKNSVSVFREIADVLLTGETVSFADVKDNCKPLVNAIASNDFKSILDGVRNHDDYTYAHSMRVATMLSLLGHAAGFRDNEQLLLASGGLLHDVGKMKIPHNILNKPGRLTEEEFEIMKNHVPETVDYLVHAGNMPRAVMIIAEQHHEKIDGTGYPHGLKGSELNELARMAAVVDVFSALTDRRVYKPSMPATKAMSIMTEEMSGHLDQKYVEMFRGILGDASLLDPEIAEPSA
ncbi:MAG: HD domain-containing protein [Alphaproteobacteria bacterium]|nr:HD domain-containing protein [Alphaproteobacteria bacterium]